MVRLLLSTTEDLGYELKTMRLNQNISLEKMSELLARSTRQITRYETGDCPIPEYILVQWVIVLGYELAIIDKNH